jgi:nucleotide-binding universal stress UspA family protein
MVAEKSTMIVGTDWSPPSDRAIDWASAVAGPDDSIVLVHAWQLPIIAGYDMVVAVDPTSIENAAIDALADQIARRHDDRLVAAVARGHPGRALVDEADERDATMIVVGYNGNNRLAMMLGSTANYVLHHTHRPVVVVRGELAPAAPRRVVVGVDDHDIDRAHPDANDNPSVRALRWAYSLPGVEHIRVVHAWFLPSLAIGMFADVSADIDVMDKAAQAVIDRVIASAGPTPEGVEVVGEPVRGTAGFGLIEASAGADLVVVGSRGKGGFKGLLLGSTTAEVAAHSHSPVAVVR